MSVRLEKLDSIVQGRIKHFRLWAENGSSEELVRAVLNDYGLRRPVHLEFWDFRCPTNETLSSLRLRVEETEGAVRFTWDVASDRLERVLEELQDCSFGAWFGLDVVTTQRLRLQRSNRKRAEALPEGGAFVIFSMYDENVEVFAVGVHDRR